MQSPAPTPAIRIGKKVLGAIGLENAGRELFHRYKNWRMWRVLRVSGTSLCRARLAPYCVGNGVDLGFGGDPITPDAIRVDMPAQYGGVGKLRSQLCGDAARLHWFQDNVLDYIYSSHLLEDFDDTESVLREWLRVLKPGGRLIIFCPDEQRYRKYCAEKNHPYNPHHKHAHFSIDFVKSLLEKAGLTRVIYENPDVDNYSWDLVAEKLAQKPAAFAHKRGSNS